MKTVVEILLVLGGIHIAIGGIFALVIQRSILARRDPAVRGAGLGFRFLLLPGMILLWPLLVFAWFGNGHDPNRSDLFGDRLSPARIRSVHGLAWKVLAIVLPIGLAMALGLRPIPSTVESFPAALQNPSVNHNPP